MDRRNLASGLIFFLLAAFVLIISLGLGIGSLNNPQTGFMSFWTALLMVFFSLMLSVVACRSRSIDTKGANSWRAVRWQKNVVVLAALAVYVFALSQAGFLAATFILMIILFWLASMKIWAAVLAALLSVSVTYGLFYFLLKTPLPRGIWGF